MGACRYFGSGAICPVTHCTMVRCRCAIETECQYCNSVCHWSSGRARETTAPLRPEAIDLLAKIGVVVKATYSTEFLRVEATTARSIRSNVAFCWGDRPVLKNLSF